jgi:nuclear transcription Y subunit beta
MDVVQSPMAADEALAYTAETREQDRLLPMANLGRLMRDALPQNAKLGKDATATVQECVSEFISFVTSEYPPNPH